MLWGTTLLFNMMKAVLPNSIYYSIIYLTINTAPTVDQFFLKPGCSSAISDLVMIQYSGEKLTELRTVSGIQVSFCYPFKHCACATLLSFLWYLICVNYFIV